MAINQKNVAIDLASKLVDEQTAMIGSFLRMEAYINQAEQAGINFNTYDTDFETIPSLAHIDGSYLNMLFLSVLPDSRTFWETNFVNGGAKTIMEQMFEIANGTKQ